MLLSLTLLLTLATTSPVADALAPLAKGQPKTQVLVLATPHLSGDEFEGVAPRHLASLVETLERFHPAIVCVELLPPDELAMLEARGGRYLEVARMFAEKSLVLGHLMQKHLGLDREQARAQAAERLRSARLLPPDRVALVGLLMASYEFPSARLQWSYLTEAERREAALPEELRAYLDERLGARSEETLIALPLARRLGLQTLAAVDSQVDGAELLQLDEKTLTEVFDHPLRQRAQRAAVYAHAAATTKAAIEAGSLTPLYRELNAPAYATEDVRAQWGWYWQSRLPSGADRLRYALWEVRNSRIASNVVLAAASAHADRVLLIIGSAHKPFVEELLRPMVHVEVVPLGAP